MKKFFSYIISLALLLSLSLSSLIYYAWLDISELAAKTEARYNIAANTKVQEIIKMPYKQFRDADKDEVWQNGELYDIISYKVEGGVVYISVMHDTKEESLLTKIADHFRSENDYISNDNAKHICHKHQSVSNEYKCLSKPYSFRFFSSFIDSEPVSPSNLYFPISYISINIPPPKQMIV